MNAIDFKLDRQLEAACAATAARGTLEQWLDLSEQAETLQPDKRLALFEFLLIPRTVPEFKMIVAALRLGIIVAHKTAIDQHPAPQTPNRGPKP